MHIFGSTYVYVLSLSIYISTYVYVSAYICVYVYIGI